MLDDDRLLFAEDEDSHDEPSTSAGELRHWRVLIVDDDRDVHTATAFALRDLNILGRPLVFLHAYSAEEARRVLREVDEVSVILLDVVMERDNAGLELVQFIRQDLGNTEVRIVLRTGQPGYAPEMQAISEYDINDYKTKSELTRARLFTSLTSAIRSFEQISTLNRNRRTLDAMVQANSELLRHAEPGAFLSAAVAKLGELLGVPPDGFVCAQSAIPGVRSDGGVIIVAGTGRDAECVGNVLACIDDAGVQASVLASLNGANHQFSAKAACFYLGGRDNARMSLCLRLPSSLPIDQQRLAELFIGNIAVVMDNVMLLDRLHGHAYIDPLTGLHSRLSLIEQLDRRMGSSERTQCTLALIDVDHFAEANDALGHAFGDQLLRAVAQRLTGELRASCEFARISGDTFAALGRAEELLPARLLALFAAPFQIEEQEMMLTVTVGIAHLADVDGAGTDAIKAANIALRRAKMGRRGEYSFYSRDMAVEIRDRVRMLQALRHAIDRQRLFLVYQPQISLATGKVCGFEALLRWRTEEGTLIPPDRFIPIAEHSGLIISIGEWVMRMACFQIAELARRNYTGLRMAVNVSVIQLRHPQFLNALSTALGDSGVDPSMIEIEITESVAMEEVDLMGRMLDQIKALGVSVALDDFGTGFSSLAYLQRLKIDRLKIDRMFVNDISIDARARRIPELVIQLGQKLGLQVIAEGVESAEQVELLRAMGCEEAQGYYYARPMEVREMVEWLAARS